VWCSVVVDGCLAFELVWCYIYYYILYYTIILYYYSILYIYYILYYYYTIILSYTILFLLFPPISSSLPHLFLFSSIPSSTLPLLSSSSPLFYPLIHSILVGTYIYLFISHPIFLIPIFILYLSVLTYTYLYSLTQE